MGIVRPVRHQLGMAKHRLYHDRAFRPAMRRSQEYRAQVRPRIMALPRIPRGTGEPVEIHVLCGRAHYDMGVAATWSLMRFLPGATLYVHSDGTLLESDLDDWRGVIEALEFVPKPEADAFVVSRIAEDYPLLAQWRARNWAAYQVTDYSLFGTTPTIISCDTDVLCLSDPAFLREHLDTDQMCWNEDVRTCYSASVEELSTATGTAVPPKVNAGLVLMPRLADADFAACEAALEKLVAHPWFDLNHTYSSQTYLALICAARGDGRPLPGEYAVYHGRTRASSATRHYVGIPSIRSRYFLEGIPTILAQAEALGQ